MTRTAARNERKRLLELVKSSTLTISQRQGLWFDINSLTIHIGDGETFWKDHTWMS